MVASRNGQLATSVCELTVMTDLTFNVSQQKAATDNIKVNAPLQEKTVKFAFSKLLKKKDVIVILKVFLFFFTHPVVNFTAPVLAS